MGKSSTVLVKILVDADVLIHLFKADKISILNQLYPKRVHMLDIVLSELKENRTIRNNLDSILLFSGIKELIFPTSSNPILFREFLALKKQIKGDGESACLVYCKHHSDIIASSNTKDIKPFCEQHGMSYLTTLDIFCVAVAKGLLTDTQVNKLIAKITHNKESHHCCKSIEEHRRIHFDPMKINY
jgi:predicted nucleic acid-binding protein